MIIYPAIDILGKKAVRLYKGDYNKVTAYSDDPASVARGFRAAGATHIHLVDLDGARTGEAVNYEIFTEVSVKRGFSARSAAASER